MAAILSPTLPRLSLPARFGLLHTTRLFTEPYGTGASGYTFILQTGSEAPFDWVRLVFMNNTASPYTIGACSIAASAHAPANDYSAYKADGSSNPFTPVTFNGAGANLPPPAPAGSTTSFSPGAFVSANVPTLWFSDWMQLSSIAPDDGGSFHHLVVRTFISAGSVSCPVATPITKLSADFQAISGGRKLESTAAAGDVTATAGAITTIGARGEVVPVAVQVYSRKRGMTVLDMGDSLTEGYKSTSDHNGAGFQATKTVSMPDFPVFYANHGYAGQTSNGIVLNGKTAIDAYSPDVALITVYSPNDTPDSQAKVDLSWARAMSLVHHCIAKGTIPIVKTQVPWSAQTSTTDVFRVGLNSRARGLAPSLFVADYDAAVTDGANPARLQAAYDAGDGLHLNDAGYAACASRLVPVRKG